MCVWERILLHSTSYSHIFHQSLVQMVCIYTYIYMYVCVWVTSRIIFSYFSSKSCTNGMYIYINIYMCVCVREWCYIPHHILAYQYGKKCSNMKRDVVITLCATECKYGTGWRRLIGCLKLQIIFHKRATSHRALLRKMTCKDKASYDSTPPA